MSQQKNRNLVTGVDIGGTHITACMVDLDACTIVEGTTVRSAVDAAADAYNIINAWAAVIKTANEKVQQLPGLLGIAMPGPFDYERGISFIKGLGKYESLYGLPVKTHLAAALGIEEYNIRMLNDATAYLAGEHRFGSGQGADSLLGITLGTGLGSAWFMNGTRMEGDLYCFPFREGVAEDYISARWLINTYYEKTGISLPGVREIGKQAQQQDEKALTLFDIFGQTLAEVLLARFHSVIPERVVLGGNIARAANLFLPSCQAKLSAAGSEPTFVVSALGENAALMGAAGLWER